MRARGFTLVEVMVALAIVAIALPALLTTLYQQADDTAYLRDKTLAQMVAANKLAELRLTVAATQALAAARDSGESRFADRDWFWWVEIQPAPGGIPEFFRIEIDVAAGPESRERPLYSLVAYQSGDLREDAEAPDPGPPNDPGPENPADPGNPEDPETPGIPDIPPPEDPAGG